MLFKMAAVGGVLALSVVQSVVPAMAQDTIEIKGQPIPLKCSDWKRQADGSWKLVGTLNAGGASLTDVEMKGGKEVEKLDAKCK